MDEISPGNVLKTTRETSPLPSSSSDNLLLVNCATKIHHLLEKFATAAVSGEYVDFSGVLSSLIVLRSTHSGKGMLQSLSGDLIAIARPQRKRVESFAIWLQIWTKYQIKWKSYCHHQSASWNWQHIANRSSLPTESFVGLPCTSFDAQTRINVASRKDAKICLDILDTTLYKTILDASALRAKTVYALQVVRSRGSGLSLTSRAREATRDRGQSIKTLGYDLPILR